MEIFFRHIDPTDLGGQFFDQGRSYKTAIFYHHEEEKRLAQEIIERLEREGSFTRPIVTEILPATTFYRAEGDHQDYCKKNSLHYKRYRQASGRDDYIYIKKNWIN